jgi:hypothetical protein
MGIAAPLGVDASGLPPQGDQANAVVSGSLSAVGPGKPFAFRGPMNLAIWASIATPLTTTAASLNATVGSGTGLAAGNSVNSVSVPAGTTLGSIAGANATLKLPIVTLMATLNTINGAVTLPAGSNVAALLGATVTVSSNASGATIPASTTVTAILQNDIVPTNISAGQPGVIQLSAVPTLAPPNPKAQIPLEFALTSNAITVTGADANASFSGAAIVYVGTLNIERSFDGGTTWIVANIGGSGQLAQYNAGTPVSLTFGEPEKQVLYRINCIAYTSGTINYRISQTGGAAESLAIGPLSQG